MYRMVWPDVSWNMESQESVMRSMRPEIRYVQIDDYQGQEGRSKDSYCISLRACCHAGNKRTEDECNIACVFDHVSKTDDRQGAHQTDSGDKAVLDRGHYHCNDNSYNNKRLHKGP